MSRKGGSDPAVWAPHATTVELETADGRMPMEPGAGGWFHAPGGGAGRADYRFCLDGGEPLPDPRSRWQPDGVHGRSRAFDASAYSWSDHGFRPVPWAEAVVYELHVGTFTPDGTFAAVIDRIDHLVDLGITHVELMPVHTFDGAHGWGYDGVALYAPHPAYGTPRQLQELVDACHRRGLAVVLDVVYNHLGPEGNHLARFGPYFTDRHPTPWGPAVNFDDRGSDEVRRFFVDNALMWLHDFHIDGLRLDAMHAIVDSSATHWLEQLRADVDALAAESDRDLVLVAEFEGNNPRIVDAPDRGGFGLDAMWNDDFHHALHTALTDERGSYYVDYDGLADVARALRHGFVYHGQFSPFRDRSHGRDLHGRDGDALVGFLQNHDQVGNRARGERATHLMSPGRLRVGAALVLTAPFVPMLFQGEEWAASTPFPFFADHSDPDLASRVRDGRRAEFASFGWRPEEIADPEDEATFQLAKLRWDEIDRDVHLQMRDWYRSLIWLRRTRPELRDHRFVTIDVVLMERIDALVMRRGDLIIIIRLGQGSASLSLRDHEAGAKVVLASDEGVRAHDTTVDLPAESVAILEVPHPVGAPRLSGAGAQARLVVWTGGGQSAAAASEDSSSDSPPSCSRRSSSTRRRMRER